MKKNIKNDLLNIASILDTLEINYQLHANTQNSPRHLLITSIRVGQIEYIVNFWIEQNNLRSETIVYRGSADNKENNQILFSILLSTNSMQTKLRYAYLPSNEGFAIILGSEQNVKSIDRVWLNDLLKLYQEQLLITIEEIIPLAEELGLSFAAYSIEKVFIKFDHKEVMILAGDSTTDAPPPDVKKKNK